MATKTEIIGTVTLTGVSLPPKKTTCVPRFSGGVEGEKKKKSYPLSAEKLIHYVYKEWSERRRWIK